MTKQEPKAVGCWHCDFGTGQRGMDTCGKCQGTGSLFRVKDRYWPNTKAGYEAAVKAMFAGE